MDSEVVMEQKVPPGILKDIKFSVLTEMDMERHSVLSIDMASDLTNPKLGFPNLSSQCSTCGAREAKNCDGHYGNVKLPMDILHPYFLSEVVEILNKVCPGCKTEKKDSRGSATKVKKAKSTKHKPKGCNYCSGSLVKWYPKLKFTVAKKNSFLKDAPEVLVQVSEHLPKTKKFKGKNFSDVLPTDFWDFIKEDPLQEEACLKLTERTLLPVQVYDLLKDIDPKLIEKLTLSLRRDSLFLTSFPITPNGIRVMETTHMLSNGKQLLFDDRTKAYKRLVDFKGKVDELGLLVHDCLKVSKVFTENSSNDDSKSGLKWIKEVVLGKRTDYACRMVVVGDPNLRLNEIGMSKDICERLLIPVNVNERNWQDVNASCNLHLLEREDFYVRRKNKLVPVECMDFLQIGDTMYRTLDEGDILLVNRPPSVHQHSLIALSVRVLPTDSVFSLNPVCCLPFRGDFDGDCIHGYVPQSIRSRVELRELVSMNHQLVNGQNGRNLLSLCHDCMTAAYLVREEEVFLDRFQMHQLAMACPHDLPYPAIPREQDSLWTGNQLFSMLLPSSFDYVSPSKGVHISKGEIISSSLESSWLQDTDNNIFCSIIKHCGSQSLDILFSFQEVLLEWISMRGLSVSLSDLYLCSDSYSRIKMMDDVSSGLREAEDAFHTAQFMVDSQFASHHPKNKTVLSQESVDAFREVFRDVQNLIFEYSSKDNSLLAMVKAGSKGNLLKLVQQALSLGLQQLSVPLSFRIPCGSSCATWNRQKVLHINQRARDFPKSDVPYAVIKNSFLSGLNPAECFSHSLACRNISFSENADVPGSLTRKLMFYMRDLYLAYDGTVRNPYGGQIVQFSYDASVETSIEDSDACGFDGFGSPVGSLAACSVSEAAYSALDQPTNLVDKSPLLNLKNVLESAVTNMTAERTISLFLSKQLGRRLYGFERGALEVRRHLERVFFSDVVSNEMIVFTQQHSSGTSISPWICHFHVCKERIARKGVNVQSMIEALYQQYNSSGKKERVSLPKLKISSSYCSAGDEHKGDGGDLCITVAVDISDGSPVRLDTVQNLVKPILLGAVIKGFLEFKKVEILCSDMNDTSTSLNSPGELYIKIHMSENCKIKNCWNLLLARSLRIMALVDWERSHPNNSHDIFCAYGIGAAANYYLRMLKVAVSTIGKTILPKHLFLITDSLSFTGKFHGLNATGITHLRNLSSVSSPFMQACFQNPSRHFIKAAKKGAKDDLLGTLDAAAWGKEVPIGTSGQFDILYSGKGHELTRSVDVYSILGSQPSSQGEIAETSVPISHRNRCEKWDADSWCRYDDSVPKGNRSYNSGSGVMTHPLDVIVKMGKSLQDILHKYQINQCISEPDVSTLMEAIRFHPRSLEKIGTGIQEIKVARHPKYQNSPCFMLVRTDGTVIDISYRKCVMGAAEDQKLPFQQVEKLKKALFRTWNVNIK